MRNHTARKDCRFVIFLLRGGFNNVRSYGWSFNSRFGGWGRSHKSLRRVSRRGGTRSILPLQSRIFSKIALERGQKQSERIQDTAKEEGKRFEKDATRFSARQRAALAASGVSGVTAEDIVSDSFNSEKLDELTLRYNADAKSYETQTEALYKDYALRTEAEGFRMAGRNAKKAGKTKAFSTLLGTAASVGGMFA